MQGQDPEPDPKLHWCQLRDLEPDPHWDQCGSERQPKSFQNPTDFSFHVSKTFFNLRLRLLPCGFCTWRWPWNCVQSPGGRWHRRQRPGWGRGSCVRRGRGPPPSRAASQEGWVTTPSYCHLNKKLRDGSHGWQLLLTVTLKKIEGWVTTPSHCHLDKNWGMGDISFSLSPWKNWGMGDNSFSLSPWQKFRDGWQLLLTVTLTKIEGCVTTPSHWHLEKNWGMGDITFSLSPWKNWGMDENSFSLSPWKKLRDGWQLLLTVTLKKIEGWVTTTSHGHLEKNWGMCDNSFSLSPWKKLRDGWHHLLTVTLTKMDNSFSLSP